MPSFWEEHGPKSKLVDTHYHVGYLYAFVAVILFLGISLNASNGFSFEHLIVLVVVIALSVVHFRVSHATDGDQGWVPVATTCLALPSLFGFPIGTYFGVKLMFNALKLK